LPGTAIVFGTFQYREKDMANWFYAQGSERVGPVTGQQLMTLIASGQVAQTDLVWHEGMPQWQPAGQVPELAGGFAGSRAAPPAAVPVRPAVIGYSSPSSQTGIVCTNRALEMLRQTKPWVRLMSIVILVVAGLVALGGLCLGGAIMIGGASRSLPVAGAGGIFLAVTYVAFALLYLIPGVFLFRYASAIGSLVGSYSPTDLENALAAQKSFWKFVGILTAIVLCIYALILLIAVAVALAHV
jgi:hypothetical protein